MRKSHEQRLQRLEKYYFRLLHNPSYSSDQKKERVQEELDRAIDELREWTFCLKGDNTKSQINNYLSSIDMSVEHIKLIYYIREKI